MRQVTALTSIAKPEGSAGKTEQMVAAAPVLLNDSGATGTVVV